MTLLIIFLVFVALIVINAFLPELPEPKCKTCNDSKYIEVNIWYDEVVSVGCPDCNPDKKF